MVNRRVIVVQPTVPSYRVDFFNRLAEFLGSRLIVYSSKGNLGALSEEPEELPWQRSLGPMRSIGLGLQYQAGTSVIPLSPSDILVVSGAPRCISNLFLLLRARLVGAKTIWWGHYWSSTSRTWRHVFRLQLMRLSSAVLFYSDKEVVEYRKSRWLSERQPLSALNNGINVEPIRKLRSDYLVSKRSCSILFIGRLTAKAKLSLLLLALTNPSLSQVRLEVVGDGEEEDALQAEALALGLGSRVRWHGGTIDEARIAAVANQCQVFVYPGEVGLSLIHAMAYGLPVIIHDDRWRHMPEFAAFTNGITGVTFKAGSVDSLVTTISEALSDYPQLARWSAACIKLVDAQFNTAEMAQRFLALVEEVSAHR